MFIGFQDLFSNSPLMPFATVNAVQPPAWTSREPSDPRGLEPDGLLWATLVWVSLAASHEVQPPVWMSREPSDLSGLNPGSPPWPVQFFPLESLFRTFHKWYIMYLLYIRFMLQFNDSCFALFEYSYLNCIICRLMLITANYWHYCLVIVLSSDTGNIFQIFRST